MTVYGRIRTRETLLITSLSLSVLFPMQAMSDPSQRLQPDESNNASSGSSWDIDADIVLGGEQYDGFYRRNSTETRQEWFLRRAKLEIEYNYGDDWEAEISADAFVTDEEDEIELGNAWVAYDGFDDISISMGRMKEPFGFERLNGYSSLMTNERSLTTSVFAPGRSSYGLLLADRDKTTTWAIGAFQEQSKADSPRAITGRVTWAPLLNDDQVVHLGLAASYRDYRNQTFQHKDEGEVFTAANVFRSAEFRADNLQQQGLELIWLRGPLTMISEAMYQTVTQSGDLDWTYSGAYLQAGWLVTGEHREYRKGELERVTPQHQRGAIELVSRISAVDLRDRGLGAEGHIWLLGVNYYYREFLLARINLLLPEISGNVVGQETQGQALTFRLQARF